jgi:HD-GYP domain-containing protein (c-di-GMP phosphodiesterase class II)
MEIARNSGTQFDPRMVEAFLTMIRSDPDGFRGDEEAYGARIELPQSGVHAHNGLMRVAAEDSVRP